MHRPCFLCHSVKEEEWDSRGVRSLSFLEIEGSVPCPYCLPLHQHLPGPRPAPLDNR